MLLARTLEYKSEKLDLLREAHRADNRLRRHTCGEAAADIVHMEITEDAWANELAFSDWLHANIGRLSSVLGLPLISRRREAPVERFSADILAEIEGSGSPVIIENQVFGANHGHLGQLVTYAAHYDAHVVVWIARHFRREYRQAIGWLNALSDKTFYAVELSGSGPSTAELTIVSAREHNLEHAPHVDSMVVIPPSAASRQKNQKAGAYLKAAMAVPNDDLASPGQLVLNRIFEEIATLLSDTNYYPKLRTPTNDRNYYVVSSGPVRGSEWAVTFEPAQVGAGVVFYGPDASERFAQLQDRIEELQAAVGDVPLTFVGRQGVHKKKLLVFKPVTYADREERGDELAAWAVNTLIQLGDAIAEVQPF